MGNKSWYKLIPDALKTVISLSPESLPSPINIDIRNAVGIVKTRNEGIKKRISFDISIKLTPLFTMRSISWRIFPIRRTNVNTNSVRKNGIDISFRIYRFIILNIKKSCLNLPTASCGEQSNSKNNALAVQFKSSNTRGPYSSVP